MRPSGWIRVELFCQSFDNTVSACLYALMQL